MSEIHRKITSNINPSFLHELGFWQIFFCVPHWVYHSDKSYQLRLGPNLSICLGQHLIKATINRTVGNGMRPACSIDLGHASPPPGIRANQLSKPHKSSGSTLGNKIGFSCFVMNLYLFQIWESVSVIEQTPPWPTRRKSRAILSSSIIQSVEAKQKCFPGEELKTTLTMSDFQSKDNCPQDVHK